MGCAHRADASGHSAPALRYLSVGVKVRSIVMAGSDDTFLPDIWQFFLHHPCERDWTLSSYKVCGRPCSSAEDFWLIMNSVTRVIERTMIFVMRDGVMPVWDDPACIDGTLVSILVAYEKAAEAFGQTAMRALGETLVKPGSGSIEVVGVSLSPKRLHCVLKIWLSVPVESECFHDNFDFPSVVANCELKFQPCRQQISESKA